MPENVCTKCGAQLEPGASVCKYCGEPVRPAATQQQIPPQPAPQQAQYQQAQYQQNQPQNQQQNQQQYQQPQYQQAPYQQQYQQAQYQQPQYQQAPYQNYQQGPYQQAGGMYNPNAYAPGINPAWPIKSKVAAGVLGILLGGIGVHKFYMGKIGLGIVYILFCWTGIPAIIGLVEGILYLTSTDYDFQIKNQVRIQ